MLRCESLHDGQHLLRALLYGPRVGVKVARSQEPVG
jgi:hypothetical protein